MKRENFYRRRPGDALAGMVGMTLEERGVYNTVIDLLYLTWRPLEDNRRYIAGHCGCAVQKLNPILTRLVERGKLVRFEEGGVAYLSNKAFDDERTAVKGPSPRKSGRGEVEEKSGEVGEKSAGVGENPHTCRENGEQSRVVTRLEKTREEKTRDSVPNGTGAGAPSFDDQVLEDIRALEPKARAWAMARLLLTTRAGMTRDKAGTMAGKFVSPNGHGLTHDEFFAICEAAWVSGTESPVEYLTKAAQGVAGRRVSNTIDSPSERQQVAWMEDWVESPNRWRSHERGPRPGTEGCRVCPSIQRRFGVEPFTPADTIERRSAA